MDNIRYDLVIWNELDPFQSELRLYRSDNLGELYELVESWGPFELDVMAGCCLTYDSLNEFMIFYKLANNNLYCMRSRGGRWDASVPILLHVAVDHFSACTTKHEDVEYFTHIVFNDTAHTSIYINTYGPQGWAVTLGGPAAELVTIYNDNYGVPERYITAEAIPGYCYIVFDDGYNLLIPELKMAVTTINYVTPDLGGITYSIGVVVEQIDVTAPPNLGFSNPSLVFDSQDRALVSYEFWDNILGNANIVCRYRTGPGTYSARVIIKIQGYNPASSISTDDRWTVFYVNQPDTQHGIIASIKMYKATTLPQGYGGWTNNVPLDVPNWKWRDPKTHVHPYGTVNYLIYTLNEPDWDTVFCKSKGTVIYYEDGDLGPPPLPWDDGIPPERQWVLINGIVITDVKNINIDDGWNVAKGAKITILNFEGHNTHSVELYDTIEIWMSGVPSAAGELVFSGRIWKIETGENLILTCVDNLGVLDWEVVRQGGYLSGISVKDALYAVIANNSYGLSARINLPTFTDVVPPLLYQVMIYDMDLRGVRLLQACKKLIGTLPPEPKVIIRADGNWIDIKEVP